MLVATPLPPLNQENAEHVPQHRRDADEEPKKINHTIALGFGDAIHDARSDQHRHEALGHVEEEDDEEEFLAEQPPDICRPDIPAAGRARIDTSTFGDDQTEWD